jgi:geranylgeranyl diphosphate synthase, type II
MHTLEELQSIIEEEIKLFSNKLNHKNSLYKPIEYILQLGGKKLRPTLCLLSADIFGADIKTAIPAALAIELFHNFSLMHDDIMDNAPLRRGEKTVHEKWNSNAAILSGDALLVKAYQEILKTETKNISSILELFNKTALEVCEGQFLDMEFEQSNHVTIDDYVEMIRLKTSVLLAASLKMGALIGNASPEDANNIYKFGESLGIAFQLQDDLMDAYSSTADFGKQVGGDILSNKKTFLLLSALKKATYEQKNEINKLLLLTDKEDNELKITSIKNIFDSLEIPDDCEEKIQEYYKKSLLYLSHINLEKDKKFVFKTFADKLMTRKN